MLDEREILNIVGQELQQSAGGNENDFIDANRQKALATYLGQPDGKEVEGRSTVVSTDVADAIEWIMPEIVKAFTQNNEVVTFDPCYFGDEDQADLESKFVYDTLMKDNEGFLIIHQFIKDALMQKNGFLKVFYDDNTKVYTESYTGLTEMEVQAVLSDPDNELLEMTTEEQDGIPVYDIKIKRTMRDAKVRVISVPPEEFRINRQHNSVNVSKSRFSAHVMLKTAGELIEEGYDKELIYSIPSAQVYEDDREYRFYMQDETVYPDRDIGADPALRHLEIAECFAHMDINEDGIAEFVKITVAGGDNPDVILDIEEIDGNPFISATAILMSHKLFGLSIYDRLKQIQEQKTALWRNILDNMYLQNNQRTIVVENQVNLDDLLISRPGGIIRTKRADAVQPYNTPPLPSDAYKMMDYLDQVRAGRAGVSPEGPVTENMIGDRVGSEGVEKMLSQKEELVGLMIRVFAETGIKPLCYKIRDEMVKHQDVAVDYMYRGQWVKVNPSTWRNRTHSTVRVGTGSGNRKEQQQALTGIMAVQEKMIGQAGQAMVTEHQVFKTLDDLAKSSGLPGAGSYFLDPKSPEGQQNKQKVQQSQQQAQQAEMQEKVQTLEIQAKIANAEAQKAQAQMANVQLKNQVDKLKLQIDNQETMKDAEVSALKQELEEVKLALDTANKNAELDYKYYQTDKQASTQIKIAEMNKANGQSDQA